MRKKMLLFVVVLVLLAAALPVMAVRYGTPDDGEHPFVGLIVFYNEAMQPQWRCTGTLISSTVVLTAGHCSELNGPAQVWFQENVTSANVPGYPFSGGVMGTAYTYPVWQGGLYLPNTGDVGVVVLDAPYDAGATLPTLAAPGYLDTLATARGRRDVDFKVVGYGLQGVRPAVSSPRVRLKAWVELVNLRSALTDGYNLHTTNNPGNGHNGPGGTCFGDSGGAIFTSDNRIVAVNSFVLNSNCAGASFGYRVDTADVQAWLAQFLD